MAGQTSSLRAPAAVSDFLIVSVSDAGVEASSFRTNALAWGCYGNRRGVPVRVVDPKDVPGCHRYQSHHGGMWFFDRLCVMTTVVKSLQELDQHGRSVGARDLSLQKTPRWIVHLDGDTIPFNDELQLSELERHWQGKSLVFYERFRNGEVTAGNYAMRVSKEALAFMQGWEGLRDAADFTFSNWDNGAIHLQLVRYLAKELTGSTASADELERTWRESRDIATYDRYVAAAKLALGRRRSFKDVLIQRRGQGFCIDEDVYGGAVRVATLREEPARRYLCLHGEKGRTQLVEQVGAACVRDVERCQSSFLACREPQEPPESMERAVRAMRPDRLGLGQLNDVGACWPNCPVDIPEEQWPQLREGLTRNARCELSRLLGSTFQRCCC